MRGELCMKGVGLVENMSGDDCLMASASFSPSEDEETVRWKAALRQEVEEVRSYYGLLTW